MECDRSRALVPVYLDGELSEELAAPLRRHLMECGPCRAAVAEAKSLSSWFVPGPEVAVPSGFAARVTERAFGGATAGATPPWRLVGGGAHERDVLVPHRSAGGSERITRFAMSLAAAAAAVLVGFTLLLAGIEQRGVGDGTLRATDSVETTLQKLEALNRRDSEDKGAAAANPPAPAPAVGAPSEARAR